MTIGIVAMKILVFGGTGFVGLNIAAALLARGHAVTLFDRAGLPPAAPEVFADHADRLTAIQGDVTDQQAVDDVIGTALRDDRSRSRRHRRSGA